MVAGWSRASGTIDPRLFGSAPCAETWEPISDWDRFTQYLQQDMPLRVIDKENQQLLYGAGTYRIDVRIEPQMDSEKVILVGQVLNSANPDEQLADVAVTLSKGKKVLAKSTTSQFGEFQIECELDAGYRLVVMLPGDAEVALPLIEPVLGSEAKTPHPDDVNRVRRKLEARKKGTRTNG